MTEVAFAAAGSVGAGRRPQYRLEIEGLRAVAVLAVILFHVGSRLSGGYIGVDVFFVISGFLITRNILEDRQSVSSRSSGSTSGGSAGCSRPLPPRCS